MPSLTKIEKALVISIGEKLDEPNAKDRSLGNLLFSKPNACRSFLTFSTPIFLRSLIETILID